MAIAHYDPLHERLPNRHDKAHIMNLLGIRAQNIISSWIHSVVQTNGATILRSKGILAFPKEPRRYVYQGVHMLLSGNVQREWRKDEPRQSRIVFIGRDLDTESLRKGFEACRV